MAVLDVPTRLRNRCAADGHERVEAADTPGLCAVCAPCPTCRSENPLHDAWHCEVVADARRMQAEAR
jgi:hypothetical protein